MILRRKGSPRFSTEYIRKADNKDRSNSKATEYSMSNQRCLRLYQLVSHKSHFLLLPNSSFIWLFEICLYFSVLHTVDGEYLNMTLSGMDPAKTEEGAFGELRTMMGRVLSINDVLSNCLFIII